MKEGKKMKKVISIIVSVTMLLILGGCDEKNFMGYSGVEKAKIITNDGKKLEASADDLFEEYDFDHEKFEKNYKGASIEFIGTVKDIKKDTSVYIGNCIAGEQNKIVFEEGWCLIIGNENKTYNLEDYDVGQTLKVSTGIINPAFDNQFLQGVSENERVVWLIGNDEIWKDVINEQITEIMIY